MVSCTEASLGSQRRWRGMVFAGWLRPSSRWSRGGLDHTAELRWDRSLGAAGRWKFAAAQTPVLLMGRKPFQAFWRGSPYILDVSFGFPFVNEVSNSNSWAAFVCWQCKLLGQGYFFSLIASKELGCLLILSCLGLWLLQGHEGIIIFSLQT